MDDELDTDQYEIISKEELQKLRKAASNQRPTPVATDDVEGMHSSVTLIESMDRLASQMSRLIRIFEQANKELYDEYSQGFHDESRKLDTVIAQNQRIARGVLAVADLVQHPSKHASQTDDALKQMSEPEEPVPDAGEGAYPLQEQPSEQSSAAPPSRRNMMHEFS